MLQHIEINPRGKAKNSIIFLHGLGADADDFVDIVNELSLPDEFQVRFIFPNAPLRPVTFAGGSLLRAWFDIESLDEAGINKNKSSIYETQQLIAELIEEEIARGIASDKIFIGGFSQGGAMALQCGLSFSKPLAGIIVLSGFLPLADEVTSTMAPSNAKIPILMLHGTLDHVVTMALAKSSYKKLHDCNLPVTWHSYPMYHTTCPEEINDIRNWLIHMMSHT